MRRKARSISEALLEASELLRTAGVPQPRREASSLFAHTTGRDHTFLLAHAKDAVASDVLARFRSALTRRAAGEPLQYITGRQEFFGLDFEITPDVLIPRPETELLVEAAIAVLGEGNFELKGSSICDVGTGSGCISIAILKTLADVRAIGIDISLPALLVARRNALHHNVDERFSLIASDGFSAMSDGIHSFSVIVSNPPYVAQEAMSGLQREVRDYEPRVALTPGGDGLQVIRQLIAEAPRFLAKRGYLLFEIGFDQHEAVHRYIDAAVFELIDIHKDLRGIPRTVALRKR